MATTAAESLNAAANIFVTMVIACVAVMHWRNNLLSQKLTICVAVFVTRIVSGTLAIKHGFTHRC